jgi:DNA-binding GntR family transcriptional regulator
VDHAPVPAAVREVERYNLAEIERRHQAQCRAEHRALMDAAMARDPKRACKLLDEHFWETTEIILQSGFGAAAEPARASPRRAGA